MNLDDELRATLRAHASDAPDGAATLSGVRGRERRIRIRQRVGGAGAVAALAVATVVAVPYALANHHGGRGTAGPAAPPTATATSASPSATATATPAASRVPLAPAAFTPVRFPLTPHWTPSVLAAPTVGRTVGQVRLVYSGTNPEFMMATATPTSPAPDWTPTGTRHTTVNGHAATLLTGVNSLHQPAVFLRWRVGGQWIGVEAGGIASGDVTRYANGLTEHPMPAPAAPLSVSLAPRGWQVGFQEYHPEQTPEELHFCLTAANNVNGDQQLSLCIARTADSDQSIGGTPVKVGQDPGEIKVGDDGLVTLVVHRPGFAFVVLENAGTGPLSQADLIRFAAGVTKG